MNIPLKTHESHLANLIFSVFACVADVEKNISIQDIKRFQSMLNENSWIESEDIKNGIRYLKENYSTFWGNYEDGVISADVSSIAEMLGRVSRQLGEKRSAELRRELARFLEKVDRVGYGVKLVQGDQKARSQARKELMTILKMDGGAHGEVFEKPEVGKAIPKSHSAPVAVADTLVRLAAPIWPASEVSLKGTQIWTGGKLKVRCVSVVMETHDTKTYSFVADPPTIFHYKPGQFLTLEVLVEGRTLRRSYTISSSPSRPYTISITVKKVPMGWMSNWLFDNMAEGCECVISGPAGKFTCLDYPAKKLLFLAAGSGITPSMSMLRWLSDTCSNADIVFINNVRTPDDVIFYQELLHLSAKLSGAMRLAIVPRSNPAAKPWHGPIGPFGELVLHAFAPDLVERETFVCGPPGYMQAAKSLLLSLGLPASRYHDESFGGAAPPAPSSAPSQAQLSVRAAAVQPGPTPAAVAMPKLPVAAAAPQPALSAALKAMSTISSPTNLQPPSLRSPSAASGLRITIEGHGGSFSARPSQTILEAAEAAGVSLEHSCRSGVCGTCKMRKVSGQVLMEGENALSADEIGAGYILTCVGKAVGDLTLAKCNL